MNQVDAGEIYMIRIVHASQFFPSFSQQKHIFHKQKKYHIRKTQHPDEGTIDTCDEWSIV